MREAASRPALAAARRYKTAHFHLEESMRRAELLFGVGKAATLVVADAKLDNILALAGLLQIWLDTKVRGAVRIRAIVAAITAPLHEEFTHLGLEELLSLPPAEAAAYM
jgi:hypothetical protein